VFFIIKTADVVFRVPREFDRIPPQKRRANFCSIQWPWGGSL
jgi:hypothetical protein